MCIQNTFNKVIKAGYYPRTTRQNASSNFMCSALTHAMLNSIITHKEMDVAKSVINRYLDGESSLETVLWLNGYDHDLDVRLRIYLNWKTRPKLQHIS